MDWAPKPQLLLLCAVGVIAIALALIASLTSDDEARPPVSVRLQPGAELPATTAEPAPPPLSQSTFVATPDAVAALRLTPAAVFRATQGYDADDGVTCGEVASSADDKNYRRFVYIESAKAGFVDDGGPAFARIAATACRTR